MCWGVARGVKKCRGRCGGCEEVLGEVWRLWRSVVRGVLRFPTPLPTLSHPPHLPHTLTHFPTSPPTLFPFYPNTLPYTPQTSPHILSHFPTPPTTPPTFPLTFPTPKHTFPHLFSPSPTPPPHIFPLPHFSTPSPHTPTHFPTFFHTPTHFPTPLFRLLSPHPNTLFHTSPTLFYTHLLYSPIPSFLHPIPFHKAHVHYERMKLFLPSSAFGGKMMTSAATHQYNTVGPYSGSIVSNCTVH